MLGFSGSATLAAITAGGFLLAALFAARLPRSGSAAAIGTQAAAEAAEEESLAASVGAGLSRRRTAIARCGRSSA